MMFTVGPVNEQNSKSANAAITKAEIGNDEGREKSEYTTFPKVLMINPPLLKLVRAAFCSLLSKNYQDKGSSGTGPMISCPGS